MSTLTVSELKRSKYRILGLIGRGQFGRVYCAVHRKTGRLVALKALDHDRASTHHFLRELNFLLRLQHPNIVTFEAIEHVQGGRFLVMDYCEGGTLRGLIENHDRLYPRLSVQLVLDILAGVGHAHSQGIVHCDIKPENILLQLQPDGWIARISDFGISRFAQDLSREEVSITGSPAYMAPERFYGQFSRSTDLYAIGVLLYELLVGHRPFSGAPADLRAAHFNQPVDVPDSVPAPLRTVILTTLEKLKARRFNSAEEMAQALQDAMQQCPELQLSEALAIPIEVTASSVKTIRQEKLNYQVEQLAIAEVSPLPEYDRYVRRSTQLFLSDAHQRIHSRLYAQGLLFSAQCEETQVQSLSESIRDLGVYQQVCFGVTARSLYLFSETPKLITRFQHPSQLSIEPQGRWTAALTHHDSKTFLSFWSMPNAKLVRSPILCHTSAFAVLALNSRQVAVFSRTQSGTRVQGWNRRGQAIASLQLSVYLDQIVETSKEYCLIATEANHPKSLLLLSLKPLKLKRVAIDIFPTFITTFSWGFVVGDVQGQLILLDYNGQPLTRFLAPQFVSAIASHGDRELLVTTWHNNQGSLHILNLEQLRHDSTL